MISVDPRKLSGALKTFGFGTGVLYLAARALERATRGRCRLIAYRFVAQPVPERVLVTAPPPPGVRIHRVSQDHPIVACFPRPRHVIEQRFRDGAVCFVAVKGETLLGYIWLKQYQYSEDEVRCLYVLEPPEIAAWDFDVWVAPEARLSRVFARLWDAANAFLRERGYRWTLSRISPFNPASLAPHRRLGIEHLCSALFCVCGSLQISLLGASPYVHISIRGKRHPVLRLRAPRTEHRVPSTDTEPARRSP